MLANWARSHSGDPRLRHIQTLVQLGQRARELLEEGRATFLEVCGALEAAPVRVYQGVRLFDADAEGLLCDLDGNPLEPTASEIVAKLRDLNGEPTWAADVAALSS